MTTIAVGTCNQCGGRVSIPKLWMSVNPPTPTCEGCGSTLRNPHGPVLDMMPPPEVPIVGKR